MSSTFVFPDTNTFLHWPIFTEMDWNAIVGGNKVCLAVAGIVFYETERQKDKNDKNGVRQRAQKTIAKLEEIGAEQEGGVEIKPGLRVEIFFDQPAAESFTNENLARGVADDHLIAAVLAVKTSHPNHECVIITNDTALRMKAKRKGISAFKPPAELRQRDEQEVLAIEKCQKELAALKARLPKPSVGFKTGGIRFEWPNYQVALEKSIFVSKRWQAVTEGHPFRSNKTVVGTLSFLNPGESHAENKDYNEKLQIYFEEMTKFLMESFDTEVRRVRVPKLDLKLQNDGNSMASHVRVTLTLTKNIQFVNEEDFPEIAKPPKEPRPPGNYLLPPAVNANRYDEFEWRTNMKKRDLRFEISTDGKQAIFEIENLVHNAPIELPQIWVMGQAESEPTAFSMKCSISCAELPKPVEQKLNVTIGRSLDMSKSAKFEEWMARRFETRHEELKRSNPEYFD